MCGLEFVVLSAFFAAIIYVIYSHAYSRGQQSTLDVIYQRDLSQFWRQQDMRREAGLPYLDDNLEYVKNE